MEQQPLDAAWNLVTATLDRKVPAGQRLVLLLGEVAPGVRYYLDGRPITPRPEGGLGAVDVEPSDAPGQLAVVFPTPERGTRALFEGSQSGRRWVTLRSTTPAGPWQRSVFNGQAQVILQSTGEAGRATLRAVGGGLTDAAVTVEVF